MKQFILLPGDIIVHAQNLIRPFHVALILSSDVTLAHCIRTGCKLGDFGNLPPHRPLFVIRWRGARRVAETAANLARRILHEKKIPFTSISHMLHSGLRRCFRDVHNSQEKRDFLNELRSAYKRGPLTFFCSEFVLLVWQLSLLLHGQAEKCMPLVPQFCYPLNIMELPRRFPSCWSLFRLSDRDEIQRGLKTIPL